MSNQPKTYRPPPELHAAAKAIAEIRGETLTDVINSALLRYVRAHRALLPAPTAKDPA